MANILDLKPERRSGGSGRQERLFDGFFVDNVSLREVLKTDLIPGIWWGQEFTHQLLGKDPSELVSTRVPIFVCPECADLGCGAITTKIEIGKSYVCWFDFGYENNYESEIFELERYANVGPFSFDLASYQTLLEIYSGGRPKPEQNSQ